MGYTTDFFGEFNLNKPLSPEHKAYLTDFARTRRMKRDPTKLVKVDDPIRKATGLPVGPEGAYVVAYQDNMGQSHTSDILEYNAPPKGQPGLWCQWIPNEEGTALVWDEGEKFYNYVEWLEYIIEHFLKPWGYTLEGTVEYQGEDRDDRGMILVKDNIVSVKHAVITYE